MAAKYQRGLDLRGLSSYVKKICSLNKKQTFRRRALQCFPQDLHNLESHSSNKHQHHHQHQSSKPNENFFDLYLSKTAVLLLSELLDLLLSIGSAQRVRRRMENPLGELATILVSWTLSWWSGWTCRRCWVCRYEWLSRWWWKLVCKQCSPNFPNIAFPSFAIKRIKRFAALCALFVSGGQP